MDRTTPPPLSASALRWAPKPGSLPFTHTGEIEASAEIIGQHRALDAIAQAVRMEQPGYNLFVVGLHGGGRLQTLARVLSKLQPRRRKRRDLVYVRHLVDPSRPRLLILPAGEGPKLRRAAADLLTALFEAIPRILDAEHVRAGRDHILREAEREQREALIELQSQVKAAGFGVSQGEEGEDVAPSIVFMQGEEARSRAAVHMLAREGLLGRDLAQLDEDFERLEDRLARVIAQARARHIQANRKVAEVERRAVFEDTAPLFAELAERFGKARTWLKELHIAVSERVDDLREPRGGSPGDGEEPEAEWLSAFEVNCLLRAPVGRAAPITIVPDPTFSNLFGGVTHDGVAAGPINHSHLRAGAIHDADGGFLVLNAADLLMEPGAWKTLKRAMVFGELGLQNQENAVQGVAAILRPDPVPLDVKVVLVGDDETAGLLFDEDPDARAVFKMLIEMEEDAWVDETLPGQVAAFLSRMAKAERRRPIEADAVAAIVEWGVRQSGEANRLRLAFGELTDLAREADYLAAGERVTRRDVDAALAARSSRQGGSERHHLASLARGMVQIRVAGRVVGQVNGLSVVGTTGHSFGRPLRITAVVGAGRAGVVSVDRQVGLAGPSHNKGICALSGYLLGTYGWDRPLSLSASISVEQHYGGIDGDSASVAELIALLSALARVGVHQGRAITGSVDQLGQLQPIGGVNEKIEGFFRHCAQTGLDGEQGVIIPLQNAGDLCLAPEVVEAAAAGRFSVWAVSTLDEALLLLLGAAGLRATLDARVGAALDHLAAVSRRGWLEPSVEALGAGGPFTTGS